MALPFDQVLRQQRFTRAHPQWSIHAQDGGSRFTAEKTEGNDCHVVAGLPLKQLLDRLEEIEAGQ
jgi:predicted house-cleaning NTP pyrophosphatase (Maf/HAM1 superfamily)